MVVHFLCVCPIFSFWNERFALICWRCCWPSNSHTTIRSKWTKKTSDSSLQSCTTSLIVSYMTSCISLDYHSFYDTSTRRNTSVIAIRYVSKKKPKQILNGVSFPFCSNKCLCFGEFISPFGIYAQTNTITWLEPWALTKTVQQFCLNRENLPNTCDVLWHKWLANTTGPPPWNLPAMFTNELFVPPICLDSVETLGTVCLSARCVVLVCLCGVHMCFMTHKKSELRLFYPRRRWWDCLKHATNLQNNFTSVWSRCDTYTSVLIWTESDCCSCCDVEFLFVNAIVMWSLQLRYNPSIMIGVFSDTSILISCPFLTYRRIQLFRLSGGSATWQNVICQESSRYSRCRIYCELSSRIDILHIPCTAQQECMFSITP